MIQGIDVSYAQGTINWPVAASQPEVGFAMIRATASYPKNGTTGIDRMFYRNIAEASKTSLPLGAYHYSYALNAAQAALEAEHFLKVVGPYRFEYPLAFDIEDPTQGQLSNQELADICVAFCDRVEAAGYYCMIYSTDNWMTYRLTDPRLKKYDKWIAHIGGKPAYPGEYGMWQYSWTGRVEGINGNVDLDQAFKDYPSIIRAAGLNHLGDGEESPDPESDAVKQARKLIQEAQEQVSQAQSRLEKARRQMEEALQQVQEAESWLKTATGQLTQADTVLAELENR